MYPFSRLHIYAIRNHGGRTPLWNAVYFFSKYRPNARMFLSTVKQKYSSKSLSVWRFVGVLVPCVSRAYIISISHSTWYEPWTWADSIFCSQGHTHSIIVQINLHIIAARERCPAGAVWVALCMEHALCKQNIVCKQPELHGMVVPAKHSASATGVAKPYSCASIHAPESHEFASACSIHKMGISRPILYYVS